MAGGDEAVGGEDVKISAEVLQQMLNTAVQAGRAVQNHPAQVQNQPADRPQGVDRKLIPQFWETRPTAWFRIFEVHVPDEGTKRFDYLLSFLSTTALNQIDSIIDGQHSSPIMMQRKRCYLIFKEINMIKQGTCS